MRKKLHLTAQARADMKVAWKYFASAGDAAANRHTAEIKKKCRLLARFPGIGRAREELAPGLRSFAHAPFVIFFRVTHSTVEIVRILHGARDFTSIWKRDDGE
jgi:toxin ParE1/3/4